MRKFILVLYFMFASQLLWSQTSLLTIVRNDKAELRNVQLLGVNDSVISVLYDNSQTHIMLDDIHEIIMEESSSKVGMGGAFGGVIGAIAGFIIGSEEDKKEVGRNSYYNHTAEQGNTYKLQYAMYGLGIGGFMGAGIGGLFNENKEKAFVISYLKAEEKKTVILGIFGGRPLPRSKYVEQQIQMKESTQNVTEVLEVEQQNPKLQFYAAVGTGIPVGDFGATGISSASGLAKTGFLFRGGVVVGLSKRFNAALEVEHSRYGVDVSEFEKYAIIQSTGSWIVTIPSLGFKFCTNPSKKNLLFLQGSVGIAAVTAPLLEMTVNGIPFRQAESKASDFVYTVGADLLFGKHYNLNLSYKYSKPEFGVSIMQGGSFLIGTAEQKIKIFSLTLGYYF